MSNKSDFLAYIETTEDTTDEEVAEFRDGLVALMGYYGVLVVSAATLDVDSTTPEVDPRAN